MLGDDRGFDEEYTYFLDETDVNLRLGEQAGRSHSFQRPRCITVSSRIVCGTRRGFLALAMSWRDRRRTSVGKTRCIRSAAEIRSHLRHFRAKLRRRVSWHALSGQLSLAESRKMCAEIDRGLAAGAAAAEVRSSRGRETLVGHSDLASTFQPARGPESAGEARVCAG